MATKTITILDMAYASLKQLKGRGESFSDVILRLTKRRALADFAGTLSEKEANQMEKENLAARKRSRERARRLEKELNDS